MITKAYKPKRRGGKRRILHETDADAAHGVTFETVSKKTKTGQIKTTKVKVSLENRNTGPSVPPTASSHRPSSPDPYLFPNMNDFSDTAALPQIDAPPCKVRIQIDC